MSDPIQETTETNGSRRKGLEAWAASIAARQQQPGPPPAPENDGSGPAYSHPGSSQRIHNVKAVTGVQKGHQTQKNTDGVLLSRNEQKVQPELSPKEARELMKNVGTAKSQAATESKTTAPPAPPVPTAQAPEVKMEKSIERATKQEVAKEAQTVTAEEVQQSPGVANAVSSKSVKSSGKAEKTETSKPEVEEAEEEKEAESLIKPGNDTRASAYVRAGDLMPDGGSNPDLDDYMLAL